MLTQDQMARRANVLGSSQVGILMNGTDADILNLWREMVGDPEYVAPDLSGVWPVRLGSHTEALNLDWYESKTGHVLDRGRHVISPDLPWAGATLDAWDVDAKHCVECKHVNGFSKLPDVIGRYQPQLHWQMYVTQTDQIAISVIIGANEPVVDIVPRDLGYMRLLLSRAATFWECVESMTPPVAMAPVAPPVVPVREVDMTGNNEWADAASTWRENRDAAKMFDGAAKTIKGLVPSDARLAHGHGIAVTRAKNGALSIRD